MNRDLKIKFVLDWVFFFVIDFAFCNDCYEATAEIESMKSVFHAFKGNIRVKLRQINT